MIPKMAFSTAFAFAVLMVGLAPHPAVSSDRLFGMVFEFSSGKEQLVKIDPLSGGLTPIGLGVADCCFILSGVSALDPNAGVFYFVGNEISDPSDPNRLFGIDTLTGAIVSDPALPAGNNYNFIEFDPSIALVVEIDIKPDGIPNSINPRSKGVIPVAILTTDTFDATTVDPLSVEFGPNGAVEVHERGHIEDVDGDSDLDLVLHFRVRDTGIVCGDTSASLTGETFDGQAIEGSDAIRTVGCRSMPWLELLLLGD